MPVAESQSIDGCWLRQASWSWSANPQFSAPVAVYTGLNQSLTVQVGSTRYYRVRGCNYRGCNVPYTNANRAAIYTPPCQ